MPVNRALSILLACCAAATGAQEPAAWQYPVTPYEPGSYAGRTFYCCRDGNYGAHLGEDVAQPEGAPVRAIGPGIVKKYGRATGYGELVVVVEHDLGSEVTFTNAYGEPVTTRYIMSIYGHLRKSRQRDGRRLRLKRGSAVEAGTIVGYINDDLHNGDGAEHVHVGIRLQDAATARAEDPGGWFRGYERDLDIGRIYAAASEVLAILRTVNSEQ
jgi:murein DD-endopeptidase MepM/ murein hydrolase activator NlpD